MSVKIGISPIAWQNDDLPDITAAYTMEQALKEAREIGYTGVERGQRKPQDGKAKLGAAETQEQGPADGLRRQGGQDHAHRDAPSSRLLRGPHQ